MPCPELTSVDGEITATPRHGSPPRTTACCGGRRIRGDPPLPGAPIRPDRAPRPAGALGRGARAPIEREPFEAEIAALLTEFGAADGQLRLVATPRRTPPGLHREPPAARRDGRPGDRHLLADDDPEQGEIPLLRREHAGDEARPGTGRRRGAPGRPDGIVLEAPTSTIFWVSHDGVLCTPALDVGILESITRKRIVRELHVEEGPFRSRTCSARMRRSSPQRCVRCSPSRRSTAGSCPTAPAIEPRRPRVRSGRTVEGAGGSASSRA